MLLKGRRCGQGTLGESPGLMCMRPVAQHMAIVAIYHKAHIVQPQACMCIAVCIQI